MTGVKYKAGRGRGTEIFSKPVNWYMKSPARKGGSCQGEKVKRYGSKVPKVSSK